MIVPSPRLIGLCGAFATAFLVAMIWPGWLPMIAIALVIAMAMSAWDLIGLGQRPTPTITRRLPRIMTQHHAHPIELILASNHSYPSLRIADHHPADDANTGLPCHWLSPPSTAASLHYHYRPRHRGTANFGPIEVWIPSHFRLWEQRRYISAPATPFVMPAPFVGLLNRLSPPHTRGGWSTAHLQRSDQGELRHLRPYQRDDNPRHIDWKASARHQQLISREYDAAPDQPQLFIIDAGPRMAARRGSALLMDQGLCAALQKIIAHPSAQAPAELLITGHPAWRHYTIGRQPIVSSIRMLSLLTPGPCLLDWEQLPSLLKPLTLQHSVTLITPLAVEQQAQIVSTCALIKRRCHQLNIIDLPPPSARHDNGIITTDDALAFCGTRYEQNRRQALYARLRRAGVEVDAIDVAD